MNAAHRKRYLGVASALITLSVSTTALHAAAAPAPSGNAEPARAFVRLELPKRKVYVGESIPVTVRAYYRADTGATVTGVPAFNASDFVVRAAEPTQGQMTLGGTSYRVMTWKERLSPVKAGKYRLGVDLPSTIEWQDTVALAPETPEPSDDSEDPFGDLFGGGDPFFGGADPFAHIQQRMRRMMNHMMSGQSVAGPVQRRAVVLHAPEATLDVQALPTAGRPADFGGAVGQFELAAGAEPTKVRAGEPITLSVRLTGEGNFERADWPGIPASPELKSYPPSSTSGEHDRTFRQALIPQHAGVTQIPAISWSFFDPEQAKFVTLSSAPIAIQVEPGSGTAASSNGTIPKAGSGPALEPNADSIGHPVASLRPVFMRPWFWAAQGGGLAVLSAACLLIGGRRRWAMNGERARRRAAERAIAKLRERMERARVDGDGPTFFAAARGAIQHALGARFGLEPSAITLSDVESRLGAERAEALRPVFDADDARFSGAQPKTRELGNSGQIVEQVLAQLKQMEAV